MSRSSRPATHWGTEASAMTGQSPARARAALRKRRRVHVHVCAC